MDRELSWLDFNERVLNLAENQNTPLLERVRFLSIFSSNLDDFFMIRVANLKRKIELGITNKNSAGFTPEDLLSEITKRSQVLIDRQIECFHSNILPQLRESDINLLSWNDFTDDERKKLGEYFYTTIFPVLTPMAVDPTHPFPYISGLSLSLAVIVRHPDSQEEYFARVKVPPVLPRFITPNRSGKKRFIAIEEVITFHLAELFPGMIIVDYYTFRLTRNQDIELDEDESEDLLKSMEQELKLRKFGPAVRLEVDKEIKPGLLKRLVEELELTEDEVIKYQQPLDLSALTQIADLNRPELKYKLHQSRIPEELLVVENEGPDNLFAQLSKSEILLHHPYDSFSATVLRFLEEAARDPAVLAIKQTLYRTSGDSPIVEALVEAAQSGKQVLAVVEIRARFDELANMRWARTLEEAGVHVVFGLLGLKTHAKLSLVVRQEVNGLKRYCHVGTGNYNPKTARLYEDIGLLSADTNLGLDLSRLFNQLSGFIVQSDFSRLLVAPKGLRSGLLERIEREIQNAQLGKVSGIRIKLNSLVDPEFIDAFYRASSAGVKIDLNIRGICALKPRVMGLSENIRVRSYLGRFLEHSRIFHFVNNGDPEYFIGSADLMDRNLDRRVEALVKIQTPAHKEELDAMLNEYFGDHYKYWNLGSNGKWDEITADSDSKMLQDIQLSGYFK